VARFCAGPDVSVLPQSGNIGTSGNGDVVWMHRKAENADWYFIAAPRRGTFTGSVDFRCTGTVSLWNPVTGDSEPAACKTSNGRTSIDFDLRRGECRFVVFRHDMSEKPAAVGYIASAEYVPSGWEISFPEGWGAPAREALDTLASWKDLGFGEEASSFSGTAEYTAKVILPPVEKNARYVMDLGRVKMIAEVSVNGKTYQPLWCEPYCVDITDAVRKGENVLCISVTSTWFNRLRYDASLPEGERKTWTLCGPSPDAFLRPSGLLGPVVVKVEQQVLKR